MTVIYRFLCMWQTVCRFSLLRVSVGEICRREVSGLVFLGDVRGTVREGNVLVGLLLKRELYVRELTGGELSLWGAVRGATVRGKLSGGEFTGHPGMYLLVFLHTFDFSQHERNS